MSKVRDELRAMGIFNSHMLAKAANADGRGKAVYVAYDPSQDHGMMLQARYRVVRVGYHTDPIEYRDKTFTVHSREVRPYKRDAAIEWASKEFEVWGDIEDWGTIPGLPGDVFPFGTLQWFRYTRKAHRLALRKARVQS